MYTFKDITGEEWKVREFTEGDRAAVLTSCGVDLIAESEEGMLEGIPELLSGTTWRPVLEYLINDQLKERAVTFEELRMNRFGASTIRTARKAVWDTFRDFFQESMSLRAVMWDKLVEVQASHLVSVAKQTGEMIGETLAKSLAESTDAAMHAAKDGLAKSLESSGDKPALLA